MSFEELVRNLYPEIDEKLKSPQFDLSEKILTIKIENDLTQVEMAYYMELSLQKYLQLELVDLKISPTEYEEAICNFENNFKKISRTEIDAEAIFNYPNFSFHSNNFKWIDERNLGQKVNVHHNKLFTALETNEKFICTITDRIKLPENFGHLKEILTVSRIESYPNKFLSGRLDEQHSEYIDNGLSRNDTAFYEFSFKTNEQEYSLN